MDKFKIGDKVISTEFDWNDDKRYRTVIGCKNGHYALSANEEVIDNEYIDPRFIWTDKELELYKPEEKVYTLIDLLNNQGKVFIKKDSNDLYKRENNAMYFKNKHDKRWVKSNNEVTWFLKQEFIEYIEPKVDWSKVDEWAKIVVNYDGVKLNRYFLAYNQELDTINYTRYDKFTIGDSCGINKPAELCELYIEEKYN